MPTLDHAWAIEQFTFSGVTYDDSNGGPLDWEYQDSSSEISDRVAGQVYTGIILVPERDLTVSITMRDPFSSITPSTQSDLVLTLKKDDGTINEVITFKNMVYLTQRAGGRKSSVAQSTLLFRYEGSGAGRIARV